MARHRYRTVGFLVLSMVCAVRGTAQTSTGTAGTSQSTHALPGVELDRLVAVVNGEVILESDVDEERRMNAFQPFQDSSKSFSRERAIDRLVDRVLILQQAKLQPDQEISDAAVEAQLATLRQDIPACKQYHCATAAGWMKFVTDQGFTMDELMRRWRERMQVLRFIELRFRAGIRISDDEVKDYYEKTLLPEYERQKSVAPKLNTIADRIQEILLQQQVGNLLVDWLKTLRAQGSVRMMQPGEVAP